MLHWDKGVVEGRTYKNTTLGLQFTPPPTLELGMPELKGTPGVLPLLVTINAVSEHDSSTGKAIAFYAEGLRYHPEGQRLTDAYLNRVVSDNQKGGFSPVGAISHRRFGGSVFVRQDFRKQLAYEAVLFKACSVEALVFIFAGSDKEVVNDLMAATQVKLDLMHLSCGSAALP